MLMVIDSFVMVVLYIILTRLASIIFTPLKLFYFVVEFKAETIASLVAKKLRELELPPLKTFCIGMEGSTDAKYARKVAEFIKSEHTEIVLTPDDFFNAIPQVIHDIESIDTTSVRASVGNWLVSKYRRENTDCKVVFNGDGSDELFGGYDMYARVAPEDRRRLFLHKIRHLSRTELQRVDRCSMGLGVEARVPYLDLQMLLLSMRIPLEMKVRDGYEKWILRETFADVLPDYIKARHKNPMSHSSGLHERARLYKPLFPRIYRSFGYEALGPMRRDFSSVLRSHNFDLEAAIAAAETAQDYSTAERTRDFAGAVRWNAQALLPRR
jgi:asparagine synthase (glutamine-hydrolysing)